MLIQKYKKRFLFAKDMVLKDDLRKDERYVYEINPMLFLELAID